MKSQDIGELQKAVGELKAHISVKNVVDRKLNRICANIEHLIDSVLNPEIERNSFQSDEGNDLTLSADREGSESFNGEISMDSPFRSDLGGIRPTLEAQNILDKAAFHEPPACRPPNQLRSPQSSSSLKGLAAKVDARTPTQRCRKSPSTPTPEKVKGCRASVASSPRNVVLLKKPEGNFKSHPTPELPDYGISDPPNRAHPSLVLEPPDVRLPLLLPPGQTPMAARSVDARNAQIFDRTSNLRMMNFDAEPNTESNIMYSGRSSSVASNYSQSTYQNSSTHPPSSDATHPFPESTNVLLLEDSQPVEGNRQWKVDPQINSKSLSARNFRRKNSIQHPRQANSLPEDKTLIRNRDSKRIITTDPKSSGPLLLPKLNGKSLPSEYDIGTTSSLATKKSSMSMSFRLSLPFDAAPALMPMLDGHPMTLEPCADTTTRSFMSSLNEDVRVRVEVVEEEDQIHQEEPGDKGHPTP